jgi:hypothetical protein
VKARPFAAGFVEQRGSALPLAMMVLVLLTSLTTAFLAMSATEPLIAGNLRSGDQALALAEAAVERTRWALDNPGAAASGLTNPLPDPVPAPYNGGALIALGPGAYQVAVTAAPTAKDRTITATGYVLRNGAVLPGVPPIPGANIAAMRVIQVVYSSLGGISPPGALSTGGTVQLNGSATISGTSSTCGPKAGVTITNVSAASGQANTINTNGSVSITGTPTGTSTITNPEFQQSLPSAADLAALKAKAQASGTYIQPTSSSITLTPTNGLVFVDTINGQALSSPFDPAVDAAKLPSVTVNGSFSASGWLVVLGSLRLNGSSSYTGFIFTLNDFQANGSMNIVGALMSQNAVDTVATVVDTQVNGSSSITYDCAAIATGGGTLALGYTMTSGTWRDCPAGAC